MLESLYKLAKIQKATITEKEHSISVKIVSKLKAKTFEGCERYTLAYRYLQENS